MIVDEKSIVIEMAHRLPNHEGKCRNIHGHSWHLSVAVSGPIKKVHGPDDGMVVDFSLLKGALVIIDGLFDHTLTLADYDPLLTILSGSTGIEGRKHSWGSRIFTEFGMVNVLRDIPPTSENLACVWHDILQESLPGVKIVSVTVKETESSETIWFPDEE